MRIVYIHQYFNLPTGTSSTRSYEMARRLAAQGHDVHIVSSVRASGTAGGWRVQQVEGFAVHSIPVPYDNSMSLPARMSAFAKFAIRSATRARKLKADVVYATSTPLTVAIPAWYATLLRRTPQVFEVRDLWPEVPIALGALQKPLLRRGAYALERFAYRNSRHIVALSPGMKDGVVRTGYPEDRVSVIPNSSDLDVFNVPRSAGLAFLEMHPELADGPLFVYTGTIGVANNIPYMVELARHAQAAGLLYRFLVIGRGREEAHVRSLARQYGLLDSTFFIMDPVPKPELAALLSAATMSISSLLDNPVLGSSSPNKFFDSLAAGLPIAVNYDGWLADVLRQSGAGIVLDAGDAAASIRQLQELVESPDEMLRARSAAHELARTRFDREFHGRQLGDLLEHVATEASNESHGPGRGLRRVVDRAARRFSQP